MKMKTTMKTTTLVLCLISMGLSLAAASAEARVPLECQGPVECSVNVCLDGATHSDGRLGVYASVDNETLSDCSYT